jgi:hypothetical protein
LTELDAMIGSEPSAMSVRGSLRQLIGALFDFLVIGRSADVARFGLREQAEPTQAFEILYEPVMRRLLECMAALINQVASCELMTQEARVRALALFGNVLVFRAARQAALRAADWPGANEVRSRLLRHVVHEHGDAVLDRLENESRPPPHS